MGRVVKQAIAACSYEAIGTALYFELRRKDINIKPREPFQASMEDSTIRKYTNV
jgi:hypothetical protein